MAEGKEEWTGPGATLETNLRWPCSSRAVRAVETFQTSITIQRFARPPPNTYTRTLLDSDPHNLLIRRTFSDICRFPSRGFIARTRFSFWIFFFGLGKPPRIIQCWVWVGRCFSLNKWFPVALSCIIRSADSGLALPVRLCGLGLWKPRSASVTGSANGNEAPPSDWIQIALFMPHAWMNPGLFTEDTAGSCNSSQQRSLQDRIILLTIRHPRSCDKHLLLVFSPSFFIWVYNHHPKFLPVSNS